MNASIKMFASRLKRLANHHAKSLFLLLIINGFVGAVAGVMTAEWQASVESAQVLLGLVSYAQGSLPNLYYMGTFSMINHISAGLLALTHSEMATSFLVVALVGSIMQQVVAMAIFLLFRNAYAATLTAALLVAMHGLGEGISYPIYPLGTFGTFGRIGQFFILYALLFLAFSYYRAGFFLSGLAFWMHPIWGAWLGGCLALVFAIRHRTLKPLFTLRHLAFFLTGLSISAIAFFWQKSAHPIVMGPLLPQDIVKARQIFLNYIRYWDFHRHTFSDPKLLGSGLSFAWVSAFFTFLLQYKRTNTPGERMFFTFIIVSVVTGSLLVFVPSWFDPSLFPPDFIILMPGRFINTPIFLCTAVVAGALFAFVTTQLRRISYFALAAVWVNAVLACLCIALVIAAPIYTGEKYKQKIAPRFEVTSIPYPVKGIILTTMENYMLQIQTRIPVLTPHIDGYVYAGYAAMLLFNQLSRDIFGISLSNPPAPEAHLHEGAFDTADFKTAWEERTCAQWEWLSAQYQIGLIVVPSYMHLQLPRIDDDPKWNKYRPLCGLH